jgi:CheY-like chemotaxis protein
MANVLVVDDHPEMCDLLVRLLRRGGHQAVPAFDGPAAWNTSATSGRGSCSWT